jgi:hypothetical protein
VQNVEINFGSEGNCIEFVTSGWSAPEPGFRWMTGVASELQIDRDFDDADHILELEVSPLVWRSLVPQQRLSILLNGVILTQVALTRASRLGFLIPASVIPREQPLTIAFVHPDAASPEQLGGNADARLLSLLTKKIAISQVPGGQLGSALAGTGKVDIDSIQERTGFSAPEFMVKFESLGDNCEFGLVQRRCGAEPLGLLRFSTTELATLLRGLDVAFRDLGDPADLEFVLDNAQKPEYVVREKRYGLVYHTFRYKGEVDEEKLAAGEPLRLRFLVRKLVEDLVSANKIFVCKRNEPVMREEILPLYRALNSFGRNSLLWVVPANERMSPGSVETVLPGLFRGFIERFAPPENAHDLALNSWIEICINAFELAHERARWSGGVGA